MATGQAGLGPPLAAGPTGQPCLDVAGATTAGRVRPRNEDSFVTHHLSWSNEDRRREAALVVVADGLGGHDAGEEASRIVVHSVCGTLLPLIGGIPGGRLEGATPAGLAEAIERAIQQANREVYGKAKQDGQARKMGATALVVLVWDGVAVIGHVGDCRAHHACGGRLLQVTRDQTVVARMVELGQLSPEEARTHPARNDVYQAIGHPGEVQTARHEVKLAAGDWLIFASDGLHAHVDAAGLRGAITKAPPSAAQLADALVESANQKGGSDNCTVVVVRCY
jgi:protein phosphatase